MEFEWDEAKDAANRAKHGVSLGEVVAFEWGKAQERPDFRAAYGELRIEAVAPLNGRLHICIFTMRDGRHRIISLRKANQREMRRYEQTRSE